MAAADALKALAGKISGTGEPYVEFPGGRLGGRITDDHADEWLGWGNSPTF